MLDTLIKGATLVDGTGAPSYIGDIGIKDGLIAELGSVSTPATRSIDASGAIATPGWVDVHTHYDGQVAWDSELAPSSNNGVTTVVMGNCGVGFAPVRPNGEQALIELMEGVEDIPGTALYEGIPWGNWETFEQYMDYVATRELSIDVGAQIPHGALRSYVMGLEESIEDDATAAQIEEMASHVENALRAGAMGFSTSRTIGHMSIDGSTVPGTFAADEELFGIADSMKRVGRGVFQAIPACAVGELEHLGGERRQTLDEIAFFGEISRRSGRKVSYTHLQGDHDTSLWRTALERVDQENASGAQLFPQVPTRGVGFMTSLRTYHTFMRRKAYLALASLPHDQLVAEMRKPENKAKIIADEDIPHPDGGSMENVYDYFASNLHLTFKLEHGADYEPGPERSIKALAAAQGVEPLDLMYDALLERDGTAFSVLLGPSYHDISLDPLREMIVHDATVFGLSDAGAHVNFIGDGVMPTFALMHWARDRTRGEKLPLELVVNKQSGATASLFGLNDRGTLHVGKRADINLIDLPALELGYFDLRSDLPAGGNRILQKTSGYLASFVKGQQIRENGKDLGVRPGRLVRGMH